MPAIIGPPTWPMTMIMKDRPRIMPIALRPK